VNDVFQTSLKVVGKGNKNFFLKLTALMQQISIEK
jgi:hypothetical protein